ncbi:conserved hypothetical protein [Theileria equi strain WA]|uniref:COG4 transport protein middle alpha-helical bundle domain-containing protein n=1 Tax=Theileria equi strain WA TaxID=1537102 RepID=L1L9H7_THEEQ|nr:conserved hypothetical protein [Theileria equi strain WA]EKX72067.1 conserved hypothetical protein [Theileria equi strain WA]|eukprot:XP_004831519.1 conserved hypothetical protein [Theileria equi strain WA]
MSNTRALRLAYDHLCEAEDKILRELKELEGVAHTHLKSTQETFSSSPLVDVQVNIDGKLDEIASFGDKLKVAANESNGALRNLRCGIKIIETVTALYNSASKILASFKDGPSDEDVRSYINSVELAKANGHWDNVYMVISRGHIGDVVSSLRKLTLETLRSKAAVPDSKLLTKFAVALGIEKEAYQAHLTSAKSDTATKSSKLYSGTTLKNECSTLARVVHNAEKMLLEQASIVREELGSVYYIEFCREIHSDTSREAVAILTEFIKTNFGEDFNLEQILTTIEPDETKDEKLLDTMAGLSSLWNEFEAALKESTSPVYAKLLVTLGNVSDEFSNDGLVQLSPATKLIQSILAIYVKLEHSFATKSVENAIAIEDAIDFTPEYADSASTSTIVDDTFFILQKSQHRAIGTGDIQAACAILNQVSSIISSELKEALFRNLLESQSIYEIWVQDIESMSSDSWYTVLEDHFKRSKINTPETISSKYSFTHCLSNIEESLNLLIKFKKEVCECFNVAFLNDGKDTNLVVENTVQALDLVKGELEQLQNDACNCALNILKENMTEPLNVFSRIDFDINEETYTEYQDDEPFLSELVTVLHATFTHIERYYSPQIGSKCINNLIERICKYLETTTLNKKFSIYGAVYFDETIRSLMSTCSSHDQKIRKRFANLLQISDVLNVSSIDEVQVFKDSGDYSIDVDKYVSLRVDLATDDEESM